MLLPSHRDDHGEAAEICTEGMAVDGEGAEVLDELKQVRLASDLKVLRLAVQEESHLVHHVAVEEGKHSAKTEIRSHLRGNIYGILGNLVHSGMIGEQITSSSAKR